MADTDLPEGFTIEPFDPERDIAPEGSEDDCDGTDGE